jgi:hypothetical protein
VSVFDAPFIDVMLALDTCDPPAAHSATSTC